MIRPLQASTPTTFMMVAVLWTAAHTVHVAPQATVYNLYVQILIQTRTQVTDAGHKTCSHLNKFHATSVFIIYSFK